MWVATTTQTRPFCRTMHMADTATTPGSLGAAVSHLKSLTDQLVTVTTANGQVTGTVLSCTRTSVWLVATDDADVVVALQ
jgi:hypothetical protein